MSEWLRASAPEAEVMEFARTRREYEDLAGMIVLNSGPACRSAAFALSALFCLAVLPAHGATNPPALGAFVRPSGTQSTKQEVIAFQAACSYCLQIDSTYTGFDNWSKTSISRWQWDFTSALMPMINVSPRVGSSSCATFADIVAGKYDSQINADAQTIASLNNTVWLRLFFEPTTLGKVMTCANPTQSPSLYIEAFQYVVSLFRADGVTNAKWVWTPDDVLYENGTWTTWYPGASYVDIISIDTYNATTTQEIFPATYCSDAASLGLPYAITETGAFVDEQATWIGSIPGACPGLSALVYFDSAGNPPNNYVLGTDGLAAFEAAGQ